MLSSLDAIHLNGDYFSRYEVEHRLIRARIMFSGVDGGEVLRITMYREGVYQDWPVATKDVTLLSGPYPNGKVVEFNLNGSDLMTIEPKTGFKFTNTHNGRYYIVVEEMDGDTALRSLQSKTFNVMPITPATFRRTSLFGNNTLSFDVLAPTSPLTTSGMKFIRTSELTAKGSHTVEWDATAKTLKYDDGEPVTISEGFGYYTLIDESVVSGEEFLIIEVDYFELPGSDTSETFFVDNMLLPDETIRYYLDLAYGWVGGELQIPMEPTILTTDREEETEHHEVVDAVGWSFRTDDRYIMPELPHHGLLYLYEIRGEINDQVVVELGDDWRLEVNQTGKPFIVPRTATQLSLLFQGVSQMLLLSRTFIPAFWHFRGIYGLEDMFDRRAPVLQALMAQASIALLTTTGSAYRGGYASESESRDGVSASQSYTQSAMYGLYAPDIEEHKRWLAKEWPKHKRRIRGMNVVMA